MAYIQNTAAQMVRCLKTSQQGWRHVHSAEADNGTRRTEVFSHYNGPFRAQLKIITRRLNDRGYALQPEEATLHLTFKVEDTVYTVMSCILQDDDWWYAFMYDGDDYEVQIRGFKDVLKLMQTMENREVHLAASLSEDSLWVKATRVDTTDFM